MGYRVRRAKARTARNLSLVWSSKCVEFRTKHGVPVSLANGELRGEAICERLCLGTGFVVGGFSGFSV